MADELSWGRDDEPGDRDVRTLSAPKEFGVQALAAARLDRAAVPLLIAGGLVFAISLFVPWLRLRNFNASGRTVDANFIHFPLGFAYVLIMPILIGLVAAAVSASDAHRRVLASASYGLAYGTALALLAMVAGARDALSFPNKADPAVQLRYGWVVALIALVLLGCAVVVREPAVAARVATRPVMTTGAALDVVVAPVPVRTESVDAYGGQPVSGLSVTQERGGPPVSALQASAERTAQIWRDAR